MTASNAGKPKPARSAPRTRPLPPRPGTAPEEEAPALPEVPGGVLDFTTTPDAERVEKRSVLFRIDGTEYTVWDNPPASLGLELLEMQRSQGVMISTPWALETMLGQAAYAALREYKDLPQAGLQRIIEVVIEKIMASLEPPKEG